MAPLDLALAILVLVLLALLTWSLVQNRRRACLRARFGAEYDRVISQFGNARRAEAILHEREARVAGVSFRHLRPNERDYFSRAWRRLQRQFVDDPRGAVQRADVLLGEVMDRRGYPVADFDWRADDLSVDHPEVVENYRAAHDIAMRHARGETGTEELRRAMVHYRVLFDDLVNEPSDMAAHPPIKSSTASDWSASTFGGRKG